MRKSRFSSGQIMLVLKQAKAGIPIQDLIRKYGISEQTFYRWKKKYGGLGESRGGFPSRGRRGPVALCAQPFGWLTFVEAMKSLTSM